MRKQSSATTTRYPGLSRRKVRIAVAALVGALTIFLAPTAALAASLSLGPSTLYVGKYYYSSPHYKTASGGVTVRVTKYTWPGSDCASEQCLAYQQTGMRNQAGSDEDTNYPETKLATTVTLKNIRNNSNTFGAGTYYFNAGNYNPQAPVGNWYGTIGGAWS